jgi:hypothetical protein
MKKLIFILAFLAFSLSAYGLTDFAPHNMTGFAQPSPYVVLESSDYLNPAWQAFDGSAASKWLTTGLTGWIELDIRNFCPNVAVSYAILSGDDFPGRSPKDWTFQGNNGGSWTTLDTQTNQTGWGTGETRTFSFSNSVAYANYRINITANNGDSGYLSFSEMYIYESAAPVCTKTNFAPVTMTSNSLPSPYVASASTEQNPAYSAFDGSLSTWWLGNNSGTDWLKIDLGSGGAQIPTAYALIAENDMNELRSPKNWTFLGSNDGSTWTTLDTQTNQTSWGNGETRLFSFSSTTAYRYYKISITANNGYGTYTGFATEYIYSSVVSTAEVSRHHGGVW